MRQGLDVRSLSAERPARKRKPDVDGVVEPDSEAAEPGSEEEALESQALQPEPVTPSSDAG